MSRPKLKVGAVTLGSPQPIELAEFYSRLLGLDITTIESPDLGHGGWAQIRPPDEVSGPTLNFEFERNFQRPVWPSVQGEQTASQHLDIQVDDLEAGVEWAVSQGATLAEFQALKQVRVMFDPHGHPFCLFA